MFRVWGFQVTRESRKTFFLEDLLNFSFVNVQIITVDVLDTLKAQKSTFLNIFPPNPRLDERRRSHRIKQLPQYSKTYF